MTAPLSLLRAAGHGHVVAEGPAAVIFGTPP